MELGILRQGIRGPEGEYKLADDSEKTVLTHHFYYVQTSSSINPVTVLYAAFPAYLYLNPNIGAWLLRPLLLSQSSSSYPQMYAAPDLGGAYPNATGNSNAHNMGIERKY